MTNHNDSKKMTLLDYINTLVKPPALNNPLRANHNQNTNCHLNIHYTEKLKKRNVSSDPPNSDVVRPRQRVKSTDKNKVSASQNSKIYFKRSNSQQKKQSSVVQTLRLDSHKGYKPKIVEKRVDFKDVIIQKNRRFRAPSMKKVSSKSPSILKNKLSKVKSATKIISSSKLYSSEPFQQNRGSKTNEIIQKRYQTILQRFELKNKSNKRTITKQQSQKYTDELFPPSQLSLFRGRSSNQVPQIKWKRISQIFQDKQLYIYRDSTEYSEIIINCQQNSLSSSYVASSFNAIKNCINLLEKIFEVKEVCEYGVYLIKIYQENNWKYIIIDDYIPVFQIESARKKSTFIPAFINVTNFSLYDQKSVQIWPYLLEKAYASYYGSYQSLKIGNTYDFLEQLTGSPSSKILINEEHRQKKKEQFFRQYFNEREVINIVKQSQKLLNIVTNKKIKRKDGLVIANLRNKYRQQKTTFETIVNKYQNLYHYSPLKWTMASSSIICHNLKKIKKDQQNYNMFDIQLRQFKITKKGEITISLRQKQKRFYQFGLNTYQYMWVRVFLIEKQFQKDYRWIDCKYENGKSVNLSGIMQPGEYIVVVIPEWKEKQNHDLTLQLYTIDNIATPLTKKQYSHTDQIIEKSCTDLAMRKGKAKQLNILLCCYNYIHEPSGLIIENINNERVNGELKILRNIHGLESEVQIVPFNRDFYINGELQKEKNFRSQLALVVQPQQYFSVILMMKGGIDFRFLRLFDFGK